MLVQDRLGDAGGIRNIVHRSGMETAGGEALDCHFEQLRPPFGGGESLAELADFRFAHRAFGPFNSVLLF